jgi:TolB-like protein/DNA-binding winged helix-turn-helix (wHTH) protein/Tfp pilus assembly protein PilF
MRPAEDAPDERGGDYSGRAPEVLPARGSFSEFFLNAFMGSGDSHIYEFGPFVLNPSEHVLLRDGRPVPLRPKVFDLLVVLAGRSNHLFRKEELMDALWPGMAVEAGNLDKNVSLLRRALGEGGDDAGYIETVPRLGYRFHAEVRAVAVDAAEAELVIETQTRASLFIEEELDDELPAADGAALLADAAPLRSAAEGTRTAETEAAAPAGRFAGGLKSWAVPAAAAVVVALAAAYFFYPARGEAIDSLAVLPFVNVGGDPEVEYLSDGISENLINSLSQLPRLKVTARSSSFKYKGREVNLQEAARELGVAAVLTGRVARRGDDLFIYVELVDARDHTQVWGEQYSRKEPDLPRVQADLSRQIAEALRLHLTAGERRQLAQSETVNPVANELLLRGRFYWNKGGTENFKKAVGYYQQAIEVAPAYAPAYAELSGAYSELVNTMVLDPKEFTPKAEMAARKALELDENLAAAHLAMAFVNLYAWDWAAAEREYRRAIELNPNSAPAHRSYMFYLTIQRRNDEALAEGRRARELDPLSSRATAPVYEHLLAGQSDQAIGAAQKLLERDPSNPDLHALVGYTYARKGQYREAVAAYLEGIRLGDDSRDTQMFLGEAYAKAGEPDKARAILRQLETGKEYVSPTGLAILHSALGEHERALALLERAYSAHDQQLVWIGVEGAYSPQLRSDPRFQDLLRRIGFANNLAARER